MATMSFEQIEKRLREEFAKDGRRLVFWYDERGSFLEELNSFSLESVEVMVLKEGEQFRQKRIVEREHPEQDYLLYAPFSRPNNEENHFLDMELYSVLFSVHRVDLLMDEKEIDPALRPIFLKHENFFDAVARIERFSAVDMPEYDAKTIPLGLMAALTGIRSVRLDDILRQILSSGNLLDNKTLKEFERYNLLDLFWEEVESVFGYHSDNPSLNDLTDQLFVTYVGEKVPGALEPIWRKAANLKPRNTAVFLDSFMHDNRYTKAFRKLSEETAVRTKAEQVFQRMPVSSLLDVEVFSAADDVIIRKLLSSFKEETWKDPIRKLSLDAICEKRESLYFGKQYVGEYHAIKYAYRLLSCNFQYHVDNITDGIGSYTKEYYRYDIFYRKYLYYYDKISDTDKPMFAELSQKTENSYTSQYLDTYLPQWSNVLVDGYGEPSAIVKQKDFYERYVKPQTHRVVVIISDALRYEVGVELTEKLNRNSRITAKVHPMLGSVPSVTSVGMAKLLPHKEVRVNGNTVLVDGKPTQSLEQRRAVLESHKSTATAVTAGDARDQETIRKIVRDGKKDIVYIYHNRIDAIGDDMKTHHEVFGACHETIAELESLVLAVSNHLGASTFYITADHGFLYKRNPIQETDKIDNQFSEEDKLSKRYALASRIPEIPGFVSITTQAAEIESEYKELVFPVSSHIIKTPGGSQNYVHGGISPQEIILPVIEISMESGAVKEEPAKIVPVLVPGKITNLIQKMEFMQPEPLSDTVSPADYLIYFRSENGDIISNVINHTADSKEKETGKRIFSVTFTLSDRTYTSDDTYYLVIEDKGSEFNTVEHKIKIEVLFAGDFNF